MATTLIEMKSRALLPTPPVEPLEDDDDPRTQLVKQLLEYKRFKDAARALGSAADERAKRYVRAPADLPAELRGVQLEEVEVWDLVAAFGRVMASIGHQSLHEVLVDDTPLREYADRIVSRLELHASATLRDLFEPEGSRAAVIGYFLSLLELIRKRRVRAEQTSSRDEIYLFLLEEVDDVELEFDEDVDEPDPALTVGGADEPEDVSNSVGGGDEPEDVSNSVGGGDEPEDVSNSVGGGDEPEDVSNSVGGGDEPEAPAPGL
jgi:segregation and condensation protein A